MFAHLYWPAIVLGMAIYKKRESEMVKLNLYHIASGGASSAASIYAFAAHAPYAGSLALFATAAGIAGDRYLKRASAHYLACPKRSAEEYTEERVPQYGRFPFRTKRAKFRELAALVPSTKVSSVLEGGKRKLNGDVDWHINGDADTLAKYLGGKRYKRFFFAPEALEAMADAVTIASTGGPDPGSLGSAVDELSAAVTGNLQELADELEAFAGNAQPDKASKLDRRGRLSPQVRAATAAVYTRDLIGHVRNGLTRPSVGPAGSSR